MLKSLFIKSIPLFLLTACFSQTQASDFTTIYNRMYQQYLKNPSPSSIASLLEKMDANGSFNTIDYTTKEGTPREHVTNLATLAAAYQYPNHKYFHNSLLLEKYLTALRFWVTKNHNASNWWFRFIAYPKDLSKSVILMSNEIKQDTALYHQTMRYLRWAYENSNEKRLEGANGCDIIIGALTASVLTENNAQMLDFQHQMERLLAMQEQGEGIEPDYMFGQHSMYGRQLYWLNYGKEYINSALYYLEFCNDTQYDVTNFSILQDAFINAIQWIYFSTNFDPNQGGRYISAEKSKEVLIAELDRLLSLKGVNKLELQQVRKRLKGENSLQGNRHFWRFDNMIHRRNTFYASNRLTSKRTVGNEAGLGLGFTNYYAGSGVNYICTTGKEYADDYFKKFNPRQFPGITAEQDTATLPIPFWGENASSDTTFAGGVSDSLYGACSMILHRRGITAHKAWFYFDKEFVCLGTNIHQEKGTAPVYTTLNQCNAASATQISENGKITTIQSPQSFHNPTWVLQGSIAYINLDKNADILVSSDNGIFAANINHGIKPTKASYQYLVKPDTKTTAELDNYCHQLPIETLSNTPTLQAVRHKDLHITEAIFYQAATLQITPQTTITTDQPCALLFNETTREIAIANPQAESVNIPQVIVTLSAKGQPSSIKFTLPTGVLSGKSVMKQITE